MKNTRKSLVCLLLVLLLAVAALTGCGKNETNTEAPKTPGQTNTEAPKTPGQTNAPEANQARKVVKLGEGEKQFNFDVTFSDGRTARYSINTNEETVGKALVALKLIAGDESEYGLYVKTVGDETLDFDTDGMYWAFYENGEYAATGVDATNISAGATYAFVATKG